MRTPIVILHGWGKSGKDYSKIKTIFEKSGYTVFAPDMPGFGNEKLTKETRNLDNYVQFIKNFFLKNKISKATIIGHSFGARVGSKFTRNNPKLVKKLILSGAPLIKKPLSLKKKLIVIIAKAGKKVLSIINVKNHFFRKYIYYLLGDWDYYKADSLREVFKNIIDEDLSFSLSSISVPTLILWAENDTYVSKKIGKEIAQRIPNASYIEIIGATHKLPYEMPEKFSAEVLKFIQ